MIPDDDYFSRSRKLELQFQEERRQRDEWFWEQHCNLHNDGAFMFFPTLLTMLFMMIVLWLIS
jgi:hypothetical protein